MGLDLSCLSVDFVRKVASSPFIIASVAIQLSSFVIWLIVISKTNLGYVFGFSEHFSISSSAAKLVCLRRKTIYTSMDWTGFYYYRNSYNRQRKFSRIVIVRQQIS
jgi:hypothetical protein